MDQPRPSLGGPQPQLVHPASHRPALSGGAPRRVQLARLAVQSARLLVGVQRVGARVVGGLVEVGGGPQLIGRQQRDLALHVATDLLVDARRHAEVDALEHLRVAPRAQRRRVAAGLARGVGDRELDRVGEGLGLAGRADPHARCHLHRPLLAAVPAHEVAARDVDVRRPLVGVRGDVALVEEHQPPHPGAQLLVEVVAQPVREPGVPGVRVGDRRELPHRARVAEGRGRLLEPELGSQRQQERAPEQQDRGDRVPAEVELPDEHDELHARDRDRRPPDDAQPLPSAQSALDALYSLEQISRRDQVPELQDYPQRLSRAKPFSTLPPAGDPCKRCYAFCRS